MVTLVVIADLRNGLGCETLNQMEMTMTDERMALIDLIEKQADTNLVREMLAFAADRIMELALLWQSFADAITSGFTSGVLSGS